MAAKSKGGMIKVRCPNPNCRKVLAVKAELGGKKGRCPICGQAMTIPKLPGEAEESKAGRKVVEGAAPPAGGPQGKTVMLQRSALEKATPKEAKEKPAAKAAPSGQPDGPDRAAPKVKKKAEEEPEKKPAGREPAKKPAEKPPEPAARLSSPKSSGPVVTYPVRLATPPGEKETAEKEAAEKEEAPPEQVVDKVEAKAKEAPEPETPSPEPAAAPKVGRPKSERELHTPRTLRRIAAEEAEAAYEIEGNALRVTGAIGYDLNPVFRKKCDELLEVPDGEIILDLSPVLYLSSSHLGVLAELMAGAQQAGKKITVRASEKASRVIRLAGLDRMCTLEAVKD